MVTKASREQLVPRESLVIQVHLGHLVRTEWMGTMARLESQA